MPTIAFTTITTLLHSATFLPVPSDFLHGRAGEGVFLAGRFGSDDPVDVVHEEPVGEGGGLVGC